MGRFTDLKPPQLSLGREEYIQQIEIGFLNLLDLGKRHPEVLALYFHATSQSGLLTHLLHRTDRSFQPLQLLSERRTYSPE